MLEVFFNHLHIISRLSLNLGIDILVNLAIQPGPRLLTSLPSPVVNDVPCSTEIMEMLEI